MKDFVRYRSKTGNIGDHWRYTQDGQRHSVKCDNYGWISVNDLLPEPVLIVIACIADGRRDTDYRLPECDAWDRFYRPIGWQPLPEPMEP